MDKGTKIFCIGLNKTGTTSLHEAFGILGYKSIHYHDNESRLLHEFIYGNFNNGRPILEGIDDFDAYSDWIAWKPERIFPKFDQEYPGSKFILNTRNIDDWLRSRVKHVERNQERFARTKDPNIKWLTIEKDAWAEEFTTYHAFVRAYFKDRKSDLLEIDVAKGEGWELLCPFLGVAVPDVPFPVANVAPTKGPKMAEAPARKSLWRKLFP